LIGGGVAAVVVVILVLVFTVFSGGGVDTSSTSGAAKTFMSAAKAHDTSKALKITCDPLHSSISSSDSTIGANSDNDKIVSYSIGDTLTTGSSATTKVTITGSTSDTSGSVTLRERKSGGKWKVCDISEQTASLPGHSSGGSAGSGGGGSAPLPVPSASGRSSGGGGGGGAAACWPTSIPRPSSLPTAIPDCPAH